MSARYAPLPNPRSLPDTDRELDDAFGEDDEPTETTPFTAANPPSTAVNVTQTGPPTTNPPVPGAYDFEREYTYDMPPPGSPPHPTSFALPNDIGNSNGFLPTSPIRIPLPRISLFRRAVGAILPTHYSRVPSEPTNSRVIGGGLENDGVFANVTAKPQRGREVRTEDGSMYVVPEEAQKDIPPSYAAAQLDAVPPYWETTVHAPSGLAPGADMIIEDLPSGSIWMFALNLVISFFFQLVGFLLTYLLHTSHAAKYGSRAGLGLTLIQLGFYSRSQSMKDGANQGPITPPPSPFPTGQPMNPSPPVSSEPVPTSGSISSVEWVAFILMTFGWFILLSSVAGFWRIKHWESSIRSSNPAPPMTVEEIERDMTIRRNLEVAFGLSLGSDRLREESSAASPQDEEARALARNLREAGFL